MHHLKELLFWPILGAVITFIWINTNAFVEYCNLLGLGGLIRSEEYKKANLKAGGELSYSDFLALTYDCFLTRLLSCPVCLVVWLNLIFYVWHGSLGEVVFGIYGGWLSYFGLNKIVK